jgi:hypothetical protein
MGTDFGQYPKSELNQSSIPFYNIIKTLAIPITVIALEAKDSWRTESYKAKHHFGPPYFSDIFSR